MSTLEKVKQLVAEQLCLPTDQIADDANIMDLGADSIDVVEMLATLEDEFGVTIEDSQIDKLKTLPAIVEVIEKAKK